MMKVCSKCGIEKDKEEFGKDKNRKDGLYPQCKACRNKSSAAYYASEQGRDKVLKYRIKNAQAARDRAKKWKKDNPERRRIQRRKHYLENKERLNEENKIRYNKNKDKYLQTIKDYRKTEMGRIVHANDTAKRRYLKQTTADGTIPISVGLYPSSEALNELRDRQDNKCFHCGCDLDYEGVNTVHLDHLIPLSKGGPHTLKNVCWSCSLCNLRKNDKLLSA